MNSNQYTLNLKNSKNASEAFEASDENIAELRIQLPGSTKMVSGSQYKVELSMTADAMLGLGTELIRSAHRLKNSAEAEFHHLQPINVNNTCQQLGIYLTTNSCQLLVADKDLGTVEKQICLSKEKRL